MSEYRYYEFRTLDRSLTKEEMTQVRALSTRAQITPTSFTNFYHFGDSKGDLLEMMARWYDAHVYTANWGTHRLMFAFPRRLFDPAQAKPYCVNDATRLHVKGDRLILEFVASPEDGGWWHEEDDDWLDRLVPLRADLAQGDLRALYLAWLFGVQEDFGFGDVADDGGDAGDDVGDDEDALFADEDDTADYESDFEPAELEGSALEPPVPPGLRELTEPLKALVEFLRVDQDLVAVAAERSPGMMLARPSSAELDRWLQTMPVAAKDAVILRLLAGEGTSLRLELLRRYREATVSPSVAPAPPRKIGELLSAAQAHGVERRRQEAERAAKEKARKEREAAAARAAYLDSLVGREEALWRQAEALIDAKQPSKYDEAVRYLVDLHDLAVRRQHSLAAFQARITDLRGRHGSKRSLLGKLAEAGL
jgi:hypothetical protein